MNKRYLKNEQMLSREENLSLKNKKAVVVGCGGIGGYIIEMLTRLGIGQITAIDGDVFDETNLNRQLLATPANIGEAKAQVACDRIKLINPDIKALAINEFITAENAAELLAGHDVICDALDNIPSRRIIQQSAETLNTPIVYGAIAGWYAQICTIMPGDRTLDKLYPEEFSKGIETELGNPSFTPALSASLQAAETLKVLLNKEGILRGRFLSVNTLKMEFDIIEL